MTRTLGFGARGHAKVVLEVLLDRPELQIVGLLDNDPSLVGTSCLDIPVLGGDALLATLCRDGVSSFFVGIGSIRTTDQRRRAYELAVDHGLLAVAAIHPTACVSPRAVIGRGPTVLAHAVVNIGATLGANVLVNTGAIVEHDCVIADHVHIASGALLLGAVRVGEAAHIGGGCTIRQGVQIGAGAIVGAGAVVIRDVPDGVTVIGVPARAR